MESSETRTRDRVIVALAMRRSGHHAVLNQLCYQLKNVLHLNNCVVTENGRSAPKRGRFRLYNDGLVMDTGKLPGKERYRFTKAKFSRNLLYSFENADISIDYSKLVERHHAYTTICVVRDPFNWLASLLAWRTAARIERRIRLWKKQVKQCLHPETYPHGHFVDVNYNRWVLDRAYRERVSDRLGLDYSELGLNEVLKFGVASSFDGTSFHGRGSEMKVLERYKCFEHDEQYRSFFKDRKLITLSERYFEFNPW